MGKIDRMLEGLEQAEQASSYQSLVANHSHAETTEQKNLRTRRHGNRGPAGTNPVTGKHSYHKKNITVDENGNLVFK